jgi:hypothetical protein
MWTATSSTLAEAGPVELSVRNLLGENTMYMEVLSGETTVYKSGMKATAPNQCTSDVLLGCRKPYGFPAAG